MSDSKVISYIHQSSSHSAGSGSMKSSLSSVSTASTRSSTGSANYSESEIERIKNCGHLFERNYNKEKLTDYFNKEPCLYNQTTYSNAARIYHCLKADLKENPILKSLKLQAKLLDKQLDEERVTEVPRINYENGQEKRNTLQLAFSTLKFQQVLEDLTYECEFYGRNPELRDEESLVSTVLFDYMMRKFQLRDQLLDPPLDNEDKLITEIETRIHVNKTNFAAELAKNRIRADALTLEQLLPEDLREVDTHKAELPLYCWINSLKISPQELIEYLVSKEELKLVDSKKFLDRKCFMIDPHCKNLLMFNFGLKEKILNHELVKTFKLVVQDKSSCLAPHTVLKLLTKKDDVVITNVSGGLLAAFIGCMMEELEGRVYVYGQLCDEKYQELTTKFQQIGCSKYIKLMREDFNSSRYDDPRTENAKIILINAPCSKSALMNPMEFFFEEGEDVKFLKDCTLDASNPSRINKCIKEEMTLVKHAFRFPKARAIVYQTYSQNSAENEELVKAALDEFNTSRKPTVFPYRITPPVIPLTVEDIQNEEVVRNVKYLQFKPSSKMNGCFIALLTRDKDAKIDKAIRKTESLSAATSKATRSDHAITFQEKNGLHVRNKSPRKKSQTQLAPLRRRSLGTKKSSSDAAYNLENEIHQLQLHHNDINSVIRKEGNSKVDDILVDRVTLEMGRRKSFDRLSQIGKLDAKKIDLTPNRSSTPNKLDMDETQVLQLKHFQFKNVN